MGNRGKIRKSGAWRARCRPPFIHVCAIILGAITSAAPGQAQDRAAIEGRDLRLVEVRSPQINCVFDRDCRITVQDFSEQFTLPFAGGIGFLQSRQFPVGEPGTRGEGLHAYLYRLDLTQMRNDQTARCIRSVRFDAPALAPLRYSNRRNARQADLFYLANALGKVKPARVVRDGKAIEVRFGNLCTAGPNETNGSSSVFFGFAATTAAATVRARVTDQDGRAIDVLAKAPGLPAIAGTATIAQPESVPRGENLRTVQPRPQTYEGNGARAGDPVGPTALVQPTAADATIGFEEFRARDNGILLRNQYREAFGVRFGDGVSIHQCGGQSTGAMACTYPRAADGTRAAFFDGRANRSRMVMDFARPVKEVSMRINPTGGITDEAFAAELTALRNNQTVGTAKEQFSWSFDRNSRWPVTVRVSVTSPRGATRLTTSLRALSRNNQAIRFLFDDIRITFAQADDGSAVTSSVSPTGAAIFSDDQQRADANLGPAQPIAWPANRAARKSPFKPAQRLRTRINWPAAEAAMAEQNRLGLRPASLSDPATLNTAALPVLLPPAADGPVDLAVSRDGNSYSAVFRLGGRHYDYYGSRLVTQIIPQNRQQAGQRGARQRRSNRTIDYVEGETGIVASFTVYGAVYRIARTCREESPARDGNCFDRNTLEAQLRDLMIALGTRAGTRP
ncbi:MAG: hypothetical protein AAGH42_13350 [Pseudomonadota bacterium]